jgi:hypothetical protein
MLFNDLLGIYDEVPAAPSGLFLSLNFSTKQFELLNNSQKEIFAEFCLNRNEVS